MHNKQLKTVLFILFSTILSQVLFSACKRNNKLTTNGVLSYSVDTFMFDTVFTSRGTSTRSIKIYNQEKSRLLISSIKLKRGTNSPYFLNVNGESGKAINNIEMEGKDSIYVFASVNIEPGNVNDPFLVEDKIIATVGDREYELPIIGFGQDAIYITDSLLSTQTWTSDKPYVIVNNAMVDEGQTLTINPGARVYVHADSRLFVLGNIIINGTKEDSVVFQGDRIDRRVYYDDGDFVNGVGGEWGGIYIFKESYNNKINYAYLKNGGASTFLGENSILDATLQVDPDTVHNGTAKLHITNSVIRNSGGYGIFSYAGSIKAENCLIFASAKENVALVAGGNYEFNGCTFANFASRISSATEKYYGVAIINFFKQNNSLVGGPLQATLRNCIIYGNTETEFFVNKSDNFPMPQVIVNNCLYKSKESLPAWVNASNNIINQNPLFLETGSNNLHLNNYHVEDNSPAKNNGINFSGMLSTDIEGTLRTNPPTIGCYQ